MNPFLRLAAFIARIIPSPLKQALYKTKPLAALLRKTLNAAAPHGLTQVQVASGELKMASMLLDLQIEKDYWLGTYEPELQQAARDFIKSGMVIYDLGANIGFVSLLMARLTGKQGQVFSFEALPKNISRLKQNIELNKFDQRISIIPKAVVDRSHAVSFLTHTSGAMGKAVGSAGRDEKYSIKINADGIALDDFVFKQNNPAPDLIKMDIEGGEVLAIKGMTRLLMEFHPILFIEIHGEKAANSVRTTLQNCNYSIFHMSRKYPVISRLEQMDWKTYIIAKQQFI